MRKKNLFFATIMILLLSSTGLGVTKQAFAASPSFFASVAQPIGVAAAPGKLLVTHPYSGDPREILSIDSSGTVSLFATLPARGGGSFEEYMTISPGLGGFAANFVYVTQGPDIMKISPDGSIVTLFATISSLPSTHNGITFDHVGTFGFNMIIAGSNGQVWTVTSGGVKTLIATVPAFIEGPDVAPLSFAPYGGQVLVASETASTVYAVSNTGAVSVVASVPSAESVHFIPDNPCSFGTSGAAFFSTNYPSEIDKYATSDLAGLSGSALVTSEFGGGIKVLTSDGISTISQSTFDITAVQHEGSALVDCQVPPIEETPVGGEILPINITPLFVAGAFANAFWMLPTLGGIAVASFALFKVRKNR